MSTIESRMIQHRVAILTIFIGVVCAISQDGFPLQKQKSGTMKAKENNFTGEFASIPNLNGSKQDKYETRKKRILLHSDADMATEISKLREEVRQLRQGHGTVYVRWGKTDCPTVNGTSRIYKGYVAGKDYNEGGSGTNQLCLPEDPTWGKYQDGGQHHRAYIYGAEFDDPDNVVFGKSVMNQDLPCAVCKIPRVSVMIPARVDCYPGWTMEYTGYLMADYTGFNGHDYICVDADPDFVTRGSADTNGHLIYLVEAVCGTLACPPYYDRRELACVVCSM